ncbi:MAG: ABC transporter substrate-binding protein [Actinomycetota bacterium]|nr:ABC transporter substrate-binding protein [Actinomycetota bacterium]
MTSAKTPRARAFTILLVLVALAVVGCAPGGEPDLGDAREGGSVSVALASAPDSLDPAAAVSPSALQALWLSHTPLLTYARSEGAAGTQLIPGLAVDMPEVSPDGRTVKLRLRDGLRYSNGERVSAGDFEHAVKRALRLNVHSLDLFGGIEGARHYARSLLPGADISGISADGRTGEVRIDLRRPDPNFSYALATPMAAPVPADIPMHDLAGRPPPGVGPYRSAPPRTGTAFVLERRRGFRLPGVPAGLVDEVSGEVVGDPDAQSRAAIDSRVDVAEGEPPVELIPRIRSELKDRYSEHATLALNYLAMDVSQPPFAREDMRRAVSYAIDEAALKRLRDGFLEPTCNVVVPQVVGYRALDPCPYGEREYNSDVVRARELVKDSARRPPRVIVSAEGKHAEALERYLVQTLDKVGFRARRARNARERARAQVSSARVKPLLPLPGRYLQIVDDRVLERRIDLLEREASAEDSAGDWAALDLEVVEGAEVAPYGIETVGVLMSERMDPENCSLYHPVFGLDWSSLCLR